jgi:hypothetical protein
VRHRPAALQPFGGSPERRDSGNHLAKISIGLLWRNAGAGPIRLTAQGLGIGKNAS